MILSPELVAAYTKLIKSPKENGLDFPSLDEILEKSDDVIAKHLVFERYADIIKKPLPKVIFYIICDELFTQKIGADGHIGYFVKFKDL